MGKSLDEQETTITWLRSDEYASIYTSDTNVMARYDKYVATGDWEFVREERVAGEVVGKWYKAPKKLVFGKPKARQLTDAQKEALTLRLKSNQPQK